MSLHLDTTSEKMQNIAKLIYQNCDKDFYSNTDSTSFIIALSAVEQVPHIPLEILNQYKSLDVSLVIKNIEAEITKIVKEM